MSDVLVFTDSTGRVAFWYLDYSALPVEAVEQGHLVPAVQMVPPEAPPTLVAVAYLADGNVHWVLAERDDPDVYREKLQMLQVPGEHQLINP